MPHRCRWRRAATNRVPTDRWYTADGIWILPIEPADTGQLRLGVTDFLQQRSGDVAFVTVRPPGTELQTGEGVCDHRPALLCFCVSRAAFRPFASVSVGPTPQ